MHLVMFFMTKAEANRYTFNKNYVTMVGTHATFTNVCVAWQNTPSTPPPNMITVKILPIFSLFKAACSCRAHILVTAHN